MEKAITFRCGDIALEGRLYVGSPESAAVITHPHPLYGGNMDNAVVHTITRAYQNRGWSTLRFNFRGSGRSEGRFADGQGEQADVTAAAAYLVAQGVGRIELAGYSYGAWVLARRYCESSIQDHPMRFVAPPVAFLDYSAIRDLTTLEHVVVGARDDFAPRSLVESLIPEWNTRARLDIIESADHFFSSGMHALQGALEEAIPAQNAKVCR